MVEASILGPDDSEIAQYCVEFDRTFDKNVLDKAILNRSHAELIIRK